LLWGDLKGKWDIWTNLRLMGKKFVCNLFQVVFYSFVQLLKLNVVARVNTPFTIFFFYRINVRDVFYEI